MHPCRVGAHVFNEVWRGLLLDFSRNNSELNEMARSQPATGSPTPHRRSPKKTSKESTAMNNTAAAQHKPARWIAGRRSAPTSDNRAGYRRNSAGSLQTASASRRSGASDQAHCKPSRDSFWLFDIRKRVEPMPG